MRKFKAFKKEFFSYHICKRDEARFSCLVEKNLAIYTVKFYTIGIEFVVKYVGSILDGIEVNTYYLYSCNETIKIAKTLDEVMVILIKGKKYGG